MKRKKASQPDGGENSHPNSSSGSVANLAAFYESKKSPVRSPLGPRNESVPRSSSRRQNTPTRQKDDGRKIDRRRAAMLEERKSERRVVGTSATPPRPRREGTGRTPPRLQREGTSRTPPRRAMQNSVPRRALSSPTPTAAERTEGAGTPERTLSAPEEVTSEPQAAAGGNAAVLSFRILLLLLSFYELHHYRFLSHAATVFDFISVMTGWDDVLHVAFVFAALVNGIGVAASVVRRRGGDGTTTLMGMAACLLVFILVMACWIAILPVFRNCPDSDSGRRMCLFVARTVRASKGRSSKRPAFDVTNPRYSLLDILGRDWVKRLTRLAKSRIKGKVFREIAKGFFQPFAFHGRLRRLLNLVKWAKYLAPLVGTCNKFRGHCVDMARKRGQRSRSRAAQQRWTDILLAVTNQTRTERAVLQLQKAFRERRAAKARRRFELMASPGREGSSNEQLARKIRRELIVEQYSSRSKIRRIEELDSQRELRRVVSSVERDGIARHKERRRRMRKRLLLSPKTGFAVVWKYLTVSCVALEISQILLAPVLSGELKKMPLDRFLLTVMRAWSGEGGGPANDPTCALGPARRARVVLAHILARLLVPVVNCVFFLDVFITFFTGELGGKGTVVPKPAFARYVLPGVGLQLIVNPTMVRISRCVRGLVLEAVRIGPSLCLHVGLACLPFVARVVDVALDCIFNFVEGQNRIVKQNKRRNSM